MSIRSGCFGLLRSLWLMLLLTLPIQALAQCRIPQVPNFPHLEEATHNTMGDAHRRMQAFVNHVEDYLECLSPKQRKLKMDEVLASMKQVTVEYNALRSAYRKRQAEQLYHDSDQ